MFFTIYISFNDRTTPNRIDVRHRCSTNEILSQKQKKKPAKAVITILGNTKLLSCFRKTSNTSIIENTNILESL